MHRCCVYNKQMEAAARNGVRPDRDKARAGDVRWWLMKLINTQNDTPQTPAEIWHTASPVVFATTPRCAYPKWWRQNHHISSSHDIQLSPISMVRLEMESRRRRRGLLKEAYDVDVRAVLSERYERRAILSTRPIQQRTQIHSEAVMGTLPNHVRVTLQQVIQYSPLSLSLPLAQSIEPSPVLQGFSM